MEIIKLNEKHLESITELFISNYMKEKEQQIELPDKYSNRDIIYSLLHDLYTKSMGFVAVENNNVIGYLIGIPIQNFKGTQNGIYCPEWAHAVISKDKKYIYQNLYNNAASIWVENGYLNHAISILAHDEVAMNIWSWNGFGMHVVDAVRNLSLLSGKLNDEICIRKYREDDIKEILDLLLEYKMYMASSPIFLPCLHIESEEELKLWLADANNMVWLAIQNEKIISLMEVSYKKSNDAQILSDDGTVSIGITYTKEQFRGQGITKTLLQAAVSEAAMKGYKRVAVVFESQNSSGRNFWLKYFKPVCFSFVRKVDDRIVLANQNRRIV